MTTEADTQSQQQADTSGQQAQKPWYSSLPPDLANNPTVQKYKTPEDQVKGHLELVSKLGQDRVTWPKDENDTNSWAEVHKRLGVPEKADGYKLRDVDVPKDLGIPTFDKLTFAGMMKEINATPTQAQKLWERYTGSLVESARSASEQFKSQVETSKAEMMKQWGEAYQSKIQRGQAVIDAFSTSQEQKDFLSVYMAQDPKGMAFLAGIGDKMAESSIGGFQDRQNFTLTPDEARIELGRIKASPDYRSDNDAVRIPLVNRANDLMRMIGPGTPQRMNII